MSDLDTGVLFSFIYYLYHLENIKWAITDKKCFLKMCIFQKKKKKLNSTYYFLHSKYTWLWYLLEESLGGWQILTHFFTQAWLTCRMCVCAEHRLNCVRCEICMRYAWAKGHEEAGQPWAVLENLLCVYTHTHTHSQIGLHWPHAQQQVVQSIKRAENKACFVYMHRFDLFF